MIISKNRESRSGKKISKDASKGLIQITNVFRKIEKIEKRKNLVTSSNH